MNSDRYGHCNQAHTNANATVEPDLDANSGSFKRRSAIRKTFMTAMHPSTQEAEALAAFYALRKLLKKENIDPTEVLRPDWGGGSLTACLKRVGTVRMVAGSHAGKTLAQIVREDPGWIQHMIRSGGLAPGPRDTALRQVGKALIEDMVCAFSGDWDEWDSDNWAS